MKTNTVEGLAPKALEAAAKRLCEARGMNPNNWPSVEGALAAAIQAYLAASPSVWVRVRDLEWRQATTYSYADTPIGEYTVQHYTESDGPGWHAVFCDNAEIGDFPTDLLACAACQSDYEARIMAALTPPDTAGLGSTGEAWQRIETAPKDGTILILAVQRGFSGGLVVTTGSYGVNELPQWTNAGNASLSPTHWMPLPSPPVGHHNG